MPKSPAPGQTRGAGPRIEPGRRRLAGLIGERRAPVLGLRRSGVDGNEIATVDVEDEGAHLEVGR
jgi:hypothetical protein